MNDQPLVIQVIPTLSIGGAERFAIELAARLPAYGFQTKLVVLFRDGPLLKEARSRNLRYKQLLHSTRDSRLDLIRTLSLQIEGASSESRNAVPPIIHTHLFGSDFWTMVARLLHPTVRPRPVCVSTIHNIDHEDGVLRHAARTWAARRFDRLIGVSDDACTYAERNLHVSPSRIEKIDGMNFLPSGERDHEPLHTPPRFVSVGRLVEQKGFDITLRALATISRPWHYTVIGSGPLEHELRELAERLGIAARMRWIPATIDTADTLRRSDALLFPSRWEGLGSVAIEAASIGLPVIASDVPALKNVFPSSMRVPVGNTDAWARAIEGFLDHPFDAFRESLHRMPTIRKRFDPKTIAGKYAEAYEKILCQSSIVSRS